MAETMVERVSAAIRDNIQAALPDGAAVDYDYAARAAIEAMREPTEAMKKAGFGPFMGAHDPMFSANEPCGPIYRAMIGAADEG